MMDHSLAYRTILRYKALEVIEGIIGQIAASKDPFELVYKHKDVIREILPPAAGRYKVLRAELEAIIECAIKEQSMSTIERLLSGV